jgi:hypothetical protein
MTPLLGLQGCYRVIVVRSTHRWLGGYNARIDQIRDKHRVDGMTKKANYYIALASSF